MTAGPRRFVPVKVDYIPLAWVQVSGNLEVDAAYVLALPTKARRRHEVARLAHFHGWSYGLDVEDRVRELWPEHEAAMLAKAEEVKRFFEVQTGASQ